MCVHVWNQEPQKIVAWGPWMYYIPWQIAGHRACAQPAPPDGNIRAISPDGQPRKGSRGSPRDISRCRTGPKGPVSFSPWLLPIAVVVAAGGSALQGQFDQSREFDLTEGRDAPARVPH